MRLTACFRSMHVRFPPFPLGKGLRSSSGRTLVSVLDLDNVIVAFRSAWIVLAPHPHSGTANNADYLSERCKCAAVLRARPTGRVKAFRHLLIMSGNFESDCRALRAWHQKLKTIHWIVFAATPPLLMVEPNGFEPMTSCLQSRRSTN